VRTREDTLGRRVDRIHLREGIVGVLLLQELVGMGMVVNRVREEGGDMFRVLQTRIRTRIRIGLGQVREVNLEEIEVVSKDREGRDSLGRGTRVGRRAKVKEGSSSRLNRTSVRIRMGIRME